ncbi:hypothetical protein ACWGH5_00355 [Streptomyces sp. NPDC054864]
MGTWKPAAHIVLRHTGALLAPSALGAPAAGLLREAYPQVETLAVEEESAECYRMLLAEEADVALVLPGPDAPPVTDARFEQVPLLTGRQDLLVPRSTGSPGPEESNSRKPLGSRGS